MYFPPEIVSTILCYQHKKDLKKARLVCKAFDAAAVSLLFDEIFVFARYADMEKATLLASRFGPFVKTLTFCSEYFEPGISWKNFKHTMGNSHLARSYYYSYCKLREEREELLNGGEFFGHLCSILIVLSNLQKVVLTNLCETQGLCWCHQAYVDGHSRKINPWSDEHSSMLRSWRPAPDHTCLTFICGLDHTGSNAWPVLLRALFTSGNTEVKSIVTEGGYADSGLIISAFCMTPRHRFCAANVLQNLTSLYLHLDLHFMDDLDITNDVNDKLYLERVVAKTLSAAINLKSLLINLIGRLVHWKQAGQDTTTTIKMILGGCKMPKLVTLGLSCFPITEVGMTTFLQDSPEIRHMSLDHVEMVSGSWENVFRTIKDNLPLETFKTKDLLGGITELFRANSICGRYEPGPSIEQYLFGDGPNPFCKAALEAAAAETKRHFKRRGVISIPYTSK